MPDSHLISTVTQAHSSNLSKRISRHIQNAAQIKSLSTAIVGVLLFLPAGKLSHLGLVGSAMLLLGLADAVQLTMARAFTDAYNRFMRKLPLNGGNAMKAEEFVLPAPELGSQHAGQVLGALASFSVWPFYGALLALLVAFHVQNSGEMRNAVRGMRNGMTPAVSAKSAGCSAGGGCGTSGGCGSGGCGASAGKACGCGSGASTKAVAPVVANAKAAQPGNTASQPTNKPLQPGAGMLHLPNRASQLPNQALAPAAAQPRQTLPYTPFKPATQQPGVRYPSAPPAPPAPFPQNGVPPQNGAPQIPKAGGTPALQPPQAPGADGSSAAHSAAPPAKAPDAPMPEGKPGNP